jgi:hypothetical protein
MKKIYIMIFAILLLITTLATASDIIAKSDFIRITDQVIDVLDEIEIVFSDSNSSKYEAEKVLKKFDIVMKKYDRYVKNWPNGIQLQIVWAMTKAKLCYKMALIEGFRGQNHEDAEKSAEEARSMFMKYKNGS